MHDVLEIEASPEISTDSQIVLLIGGKGSRLAYQRSGEMMVIDAMLMGTHQTWYGNQRDLTMSLLELFCAVDDFWLDFEPQWKAHCIQAGHPRERAGQLCPSEVMSHESQSHSLISLWACPTYVIGRDAINSNVSCSCRMISLP